MGKGPRTIYLDQNKWVDLARAFLEREEGKPWLVAKELVLQKIRAGEAICPLSEAHYKETWGTSDEEQRWNNAITMCAFSGFVSLAPAFKVWPAEIEQALHRATGKPFRPRTVEVLGLGARHALGHADQAPTLAPTGRISSEDPVLEEFMFLASPEEHKIDRSFSAEREAAARALVSYEALLAEKLPEFGIGKEKRKLAFATKMLDEMRRDVVGAAIAADVPMTFFRQLGPDGLIDFLNQIPIWFAMTEVRRLRHENPQYPWKPTDLEDLRALSVAVVYCDVVISEKDYVHFARRAELDRRFETLLLTDLGDLPLVL